MRDDEIDISEDMQADEEGDETPGGEQREDNPPEDEGGKPLYEGAAITLLESMLLILTYGMKHQLTGVALADLLVLVSLHCLAPNLCKTSMYLFNKFFSNIHSPLTFHKFCSKCYFLIEEDGVGACPICNADLSGRGRMSYFIEIPIIRQIQDMLLRDGFYTDLQHRFNRQKKNVCNIEDIYDGKLYNEFVKNGGILSSPSNISLLWYTDGIPLFKSSSMSLWPLYFCINELAYKKRTMKENILIAGLWFGESKPCMGTFLKPFDRMLKDLETGFTAELPDGSNVLVRGVLLGGTCDMPAKGHVLNMVQFNGFYGCSKCLQPGETVQTGRGHTHAYPYDIHNPSGPQRTIDNFRESAERAYQEGHRVDGINGPSWFLHVTDVVRGTALDYMHQILLGVTRKLTHLWFDSSNHQEPFSLSKRLKEVNARLLQIRPPNFISRAPSSILKLKFWKASEFRSWLFYYSAPVLFNILPAAYYQHHLLLVEAIYTLNSDSIAPESLDKCEMMLNYYVCLFSTLYGANNMGINVHSIVHLVDTVKDLGPLFVYSCFPFESLNGDLKTLFHGTQAIDKQVASAVRKLIKLPTLVSQVDVASPAGLFLESLRGCASSSGWGASDIKILGQIQEHILDQSEMRALRQCTTVMSQQSVKFLRFCKDQQVFSSCLYRRQYVRNSNVVVIMFNGSLRYGQVQFYIKYPKCHCISLPCTCSNFYAFLNLYEENHNLKLKEDGPTPATLYNITVCKPLSSNAALIAVPLTEIISVCIFMEFSDLDHVFIAQAPNRLESD